MTSAARNSASRRAARPASAAVVASRVTSREEPMKGNISLLAVLAFSGLASVASANDELLKLEKDANQWVSPTGDYANHRYSGLTQINKDNVKNLRPVWTFSTGVLRGHE